LRIERIAQPLVLGRGHHEHVLHQVIAGGLEIRLVDAPVDHLAQFMQRHAQREVAVLRRHRADPDLEQLRLAAQVGVREELEHPAREGLDIRVVAIVHAPFFADALVQARARGAVFAEPGLGDP
jgi:hypothetical protein